MSFQNEFISIELFMKEFINYVKKNVKKQEILSKLKISQILEQQDKIKEYSKSISLQKQLLFSKILKKNI